MQRILILVLIGVGAVCHASAENAPQAKFSSCRNTEDESFKPIANPVIYAMEKSIEDCPMRISFLNGMTTSDKSIGGNVQEMTLVQISEMKTCVYYSEKLKYSVECVF